MQVAIVIGLIFFLQTWLQTDAKIARKSLEERRNFTNMFAEARLSRAVGSSIVPGRPDQAEFETSGQGATRSTGVTETINSWTASAADAPQNADENKTISVTAQPYNAKCDGATDDRPAIQAAFNDAQKSGEAVQFPAGTCLTSAITYMGQPFFGVGKNVTIIKGRPGQDVFATPDSKVALNYGARIHDLTIQVDNSVNAASSAVGGNNTFPDRIFGTAGGTTPIAAGNGGPPSPGPLVFNSSVSGSCGGAMTAGSTTLRLPCGEFQQIANYYLVGGVVAVANAGGTNTPLNTTVSSVTAQNTLVLAAPATASVTHATVTVTAAAAVAPPWYCGNAGFAMPASDGSRMASGLNGWNWENVQVEIVNGPNDGNYSCAFFIQSAPNALIFHDVDVQSFYGGIIEAPPASNNSSYFAWTNDTAQYIDVNLKFNIIPMTWANGSHRTAPSLNIYGGNTPFSAGLFQFQVPLGTSNGVIPSATFGRYYNECWTPNSGEQARFSGIDQIDGGSVLQCSGSGYVTWDGSDGTVDAQIGAGGIQINGNHNIFQHQWLRAVADNGLGNFVESLGTNGSSQRAFYLNRPRNPIGGIDAGFLLANSGATPFASGADLLLTCSDFNFAFNNGSGYSAGCITDVGDAGDIIGNYFHADSTHYPSGFNFGPSSQGIGPLGKILAVGDRLPQASIQVVVSARCNSTCLTRVVAQDITTSEMVLASATLRFGTSWTTQIFPLNLSGRLFGDQISLNLVPQWGGGATTEDIQFIGFIPYSSSSPLSGTTPSWNNTGSAIAANTCVAGPTVSVTGATTSMAIVVTPAANPGTGLTWNNAYISMGNSVQIKVCNVTASSIIPSATTYNVRVLP